MASRNSLPSRDENRDRESRQRAREPERDRMPYNRDDEREHVRDSPRSSRRSDSDDRRGGRVGMPAQPLEMHSARGNGGMRTRDRPHVPAAPPDTSYAPSSSSSSKLRGRSGKRSSVRGRVRESGREGGREREREGR
jgi:hypothetical protein